MFVQIDSVSIPKISGRCNSANTIFTPYLKILRKLIMKCVLFHITHYGNKNPRRAETETNEHITPPQSRGSL